MPPPTSSSSRCLPAAPPRFAPSSLSFDLRNKRRKKKRKKESDDIPDGFPLSELSSGILWHGPRVGALRIFYKSRGGSLFLVVGPHWQFSIAMFLLMTVSQLSPSSLSRSFSSSSSSAAPVFRSQVKFLFTMVEPRALSVHGARLPFLLHATPRRKTFFFFFSSSLHRRRRGSRPAGFCFFSLVLDLQLSLARVRPSRERRSKAPETKRFLRALTRLSVYLAS